MNLDELVRVQRELCLMMGFPDKRRGPGPKYSYSVFMADMNAAYPNCVRNLGQMEDVMRGKTQPPLVYETACDWLMKAAMAGETHPPTPGPMWTPNQPVLTKARRKLAATALDRWLLHTGNRLRRVGRASQIPPSRLHELRAALVPIAPTELERLAAVFGVDVEDFLAGPPGE